MSGEHRSPENFHPPRKLYNETSEFNLELVEAEKAHCKPDVAPSMPVKLRGGIVKKAALDLDRLELERSFKYQAQRGKLDQNVLTESQVINMQAVLKRHDSVEARSLESDNELEHQSERMTH